MTDTTTTAPVAEFAPYTSRPFDATSAYTLAMSGEAPCGIRHERSELVAYFGANSADYFQRQFEAFQRDERSLYWTPRGDLTSGETLYDPAPVEVPEGREAQAAAIMAMRRREADALVRAERAERIAASRQEELNRLRTRVGELNTALNEQAIERDWCSEFDQFVERFSDLLSVEERDVTVTLTVSVRRGDSDQQAIANQLYDMGRDDLYYAIQSVDED